MKKQIIRISVLQSSKVMTALYVLFGFIYTLIVEIKRTLREKFDLIFDRLHKGFERSGGNGV